MCTKTMLTYVYSTRLYKVGRVRRLNWHVMTDYLVRFSAIILTKFVSVSYFVFNTWLLADELTRALWWVLWCGGVIVRVWSLWSKGLNCLALHVMTAGKFSTYVSLWHQAVLPEGDDAMQWRRFDIYWPYFKDSVVYPSIYKACGLREWDGHFSRSMA